MHLIACHLVFSMFVSVPMTHLTASSLKRRDKLPIPVFLGFPCDSAGKESTCNAGDLGLIPALGRFPREGKGYPLSYSGLEKSIDYSPGVPK